MKSNVIEFNTCKDDVQKILRETEKVAVYNGLDKKQALRLRLLAEEISGVLIELVKEFDGEFWIESEDKTYMLNMLIEADSMTVETKEQLLAVSTSGKNELAKGFMGKLRSIVEFFAIGSSSPYINSFGYFVDPLDPSVITNPVEYSLWSLEKYKEDVKGQTEDDWDELEKSVVANLADDVMVGVMGRKIKIVVKKTF